ncbi:MAG: hypothetical protein MJZ82_04640 [Paludibacteraceae bacterium]|nr:hypothetical protein [Paludibacteraceae bacterium]
MKKIIFGLVAVIVCGLFFASCQPKETGMIEFGIADNTPTGLRNDNFAGIYCDYLDAVWNGFIEAGCLEGQHTWSGGLVLTDKIMSKKQLDKFVKVHADKIIEQTIKELQEKYPAENPKKDTIRFRYGWGNESDSQKAVYDLEIEI